MSQHNITLQMCLLPCFHNEACIAILSRSRAVQDHLPVSESQRIIPIMTFVLLTFIDSVCVRYLLRIVQDNDVLLRLLKCNA